MFAGSCLTEEGVEGVIASTDGLVRGHLPIRLDTMFQTVQFPARITDLHAGLAHVYADALALSYQILITDCLCSLLVMTRL